MIMRAPHPMRMEIITAQQREIDMMNQWLKDWGYEE